jgi:hypothetical protein
MGGIISRRGNKDEDGIMMHGSVEAHRYFSFPCAFISLGLLDTWASRGGWHRDWYVQMAECTQSGPRNAHRMREPWLLLGFMGDRESAVL